VDGPPVDYLGIGAAAGASFLGVPGPGEPVLVAAGIYAARGRLDLAEVLVAAWAGAFAGGMAGWLIGHRGGRRLITAPGPLQRQREHAVARGERFFHRYGILAVYFAPSWVAGSVGMRATRFLVANALAALAWSLLLGLGAYEVGPSIVDIVSDVGIAGGVVIAVVVVVAGTGALVRRRRSAG
jgi:membrane protein DedA with SNARE-associated domain